MPQSTILELLDILLISAGFYAADLAYSYLYPENYSYLTSNELLLGFAAAVGTLWVVKLLDDSERLNYIHLLLVGGGAELLVQALLNYYGLLTRSMFLLVTGLVLAVTFLTLARALLPKRFWYAGQNLKGTLLVGFSALSYKLARQFPQPVLGLVGDSSLCPAEIPFLGTNMELEQVIRDKQPSRILINDLDADPDLLLKLRLHGVEINGVADLYEKQLRRIYLLGRQPADLLLSPALSPDSRILSIQAVYNNLIGLMLLFVLSPVMIGALVAVALFSGPGSVFETVECSGFQNIPFLLLRFRTRRSGSVRQLTWIGKLLTRLHLVRLPQLFNVVRGEMALFGPRPTRKVFANTLTELLPFYPMLFSVKPGLVSWAPYPFGDEFSRIEYDLYYIKHGSPELDLEILTQILSGRRWKPE